MDFLIIIGLIIIIIILVNLKGNLETKIQSLSSKMDHLKKDIQQLKIDPSTLKTEPEKTKPEIMIKEATPKVVPVKEEPTIISPVKTEPIQSRPPIQKPSGHKTKTQTPKLVKPSFFERNPDLEKFIGENLINKIGIAILVLGIGFFVKFAIDQNWINEIGRVLIGIVCGGILLGFAHKTRKSFKAFSSVLVGGGMAVFYFTIAIAFHEYQLFSQTATFAIMVVITAFSVILAIAYDRVELAVLAIIGGFASPFMVSTGEGNYIVLFTYTLILNLGMLVLAYYKKWNIINIICYVFTVLLYGGWLVTKVKGNENAPYMGAFIFATLFYLVFFMMNIINNIKEKRQFIWSEISILLSNTFLYYSAGMIILNNVYAGNFTGLFTALIAVFNFLFAFTLYKNKKVDKTLVYLLIGLVLTFLSLAAPVQLEGNYITLFWATEAVLLLWLSQKSKIDIIKVASVIVNCLMCVSLVMDWVNIYSQHQIMLNIFNKAFITSTVSILSLFATIKLLKKEEELFISDISTNLYNGLVKSIFIIFLYVSPLLELSYQLDFYYDYNNAKSIIIASYNFIFILGLQFFTHRKGKLLQKQAATGLGVFGVLAYILYYHSAIAGIRDLYLYEQPGLFKTYLYHYVDTILIVLILIVTHFNVIKLVSLQSSIGKVFLWFLAVCCVFIASAELNHFVVMATYSKGLYTSDISNETQRIGFPILWGLCSFVLMMVGMKKKIKDLRIISLTLFFITILKLFIFDISDISEGGKIAAFICLGILLLVVSFMYQKLKKLVLEDESKTSV
jgi:uncharacterized membrane protein